YIFILSQQWKPKCFSLSLKYIHFNYIDCNLSLPKYAAPIIPASLPNSAILNSQISLTRGKAYFLKQFSILRIKLSPANETPPPTRILDGLMTVAILEIANPNTSAV